MNNTTTKLTSEDLQIMSTFEKMTNSKIEEYVNDGETLYFVVTTGDFRALVGKGGSNIKRLENGIGKKIKVYRYSKDLKEFIQNLTLQSAQQVDVNEESKEVEITAPNDKKPILIGRDGRNINAIKLILSRLFGIRKVTIK